MLKQGHFQQAGRKHQTRKRYKQPNPQVPKGHNENEK